MRAAPSARKLLFETAESTTQRVRGEEAFLCTPKAGDSACAYQLAYYITEESIVLLVVSTVSASPEFLQDCIDNKYWTR